MSVPDMYGGRGCYEGGAMTLQELAMRALEEEPEAVQMWGMGDGVVHAGVKWPGERWQTALVGDKPTTRRIVKLLKDMTGRLALATDTAARQP
jgi:hypothetical protein